MSGTSMSTPVVAGVIALISAANPQLPLLQVRSILLASTTQLSSLRYSTVTGGLVNALAGVQQALLTAPLPRLFGYVTVSSRPIAGARISLASTSDPSFVRTAVSGKDGSYSISELSLGTYTVSVRKSGRRFRKKIVRVLSARTTKSNFAALRR
jgi:subtilisin family serine protease